MRQKQEKMKGIDRSIPIPDSVKPDPNGCFGNEYDVTVVTCNLCHDNEVCAALFNQSLKHKRPGKLEPAAELSKTAESEKQGFDLIDCDDLESRYLARFESGNPISATELLDKIQKTSGRGRAESLEFLKTFVRNSNKIKIVNGIICAKEVESNCTGNSFHAGSSIINKVISFIDESIKAGKNPSAGEIIQKIKSVTGFNQDFAIKILTQAVKETENLVIRDGYARYE